MMEVPSEAITSGARPRMEIRKTVFEARGVTIVYRMGAV